MKYFLLIFSLLSLNLYSQDYESFETEDATISYQTFGEGYPVLIINGGPGMNSKGFAPLATKLSENNRTIIYDQRGTGNSKLQDSKPSNYTIDLMIQDIEALRKKLGYDEWIVLGHSFGGMLAYAYAAEHPERVKAMVQSHSGGMSLNNVGRFDIRKRLTEEESDSLMHYSIMLQSSPGNPRLLRKRAEFMAKAYLVGEEHETAIANRLMQVDRNINGEIWSNLRADNFDLTAEMKSFEKPVLIMHGDQDPVPLDIAQKARQILPASRLVVLEDCGHYGWLDSPDIYLTEVKNFLKQNSEAIN